MKWKIQIQNWLYLSDFISECVWSYGEDCQYPCHRHCLNQTCDRFNGSCLYGFSDEYMYCELGKIKSYNKNNQISIVLRTDRLYIYRHRWHTDGKHTIVGWDIGINFSQRDCHKCKATPPKVICFIYTYLIYKYICLKLTILC